MVKYKKIKPKFWRFQCQFDLEDQGQGYQFAFASLFLIISSKSKKV